LSLLLDVPMLTLKDLHRYRKQLSLACKETAAEVDGEISEKEAYA